MTDGDAVLLETPLLARHRELGARLVGYAGWQMPLQYSGILEEHRAVRAAAGLFDLSHMGELHVSGPDAAAALSAAVVSDPASLAVGRAQYSMICAPDGGVLDDLIVYRLAGDRYMVVANAANAGTVSDALAARLAGFQAVLDDQSLATGLVAIQGPRAADITESLVDVDLRAIRTYGVVEARVAGIPAHLARTGYTGEDGFEVFVEADHTVDVWDAFMQAGAPAGLLPVGLGARDTLRLEAGMPLYGNELDRSTTPFEAGLGRIVKFGKDGDFVGRAALERVARNGVERTLVGLELEGRGIARHGYPVHVDGRPIGAVTSGTMSPSLGRAIAMAYVRPADAEPDTMLGVEIRGSDVDARVVPLPFYRRAA